MEEQFETFQKGFKSWIDAGQRLSEPAIRGSEAAFSSLNQLVEDQLAFGQACAEIAQRQMGALGQEDPVAALRQEDVYGAYGAAAKRYGEALRKNATDTRDRMRGVGREAIDTVTDVAGQWCRDAAQQGAAAYRRTSEAVDA